MTKEQKYKNEQAEICFLRRGAWCKRCGKQATQLAHIIPQDQTMLKRYGFRVIHHWSNRLPVCDLKCNAECSIRNHPLAIENVVAEIEERLRNET